MTRRRATLDVANPVPQVEASSLTHGSERRVVIANTTPLINFAEIQRMDLLHDLFGAITIPPAVATELQSKTSLFARAAAVPQLPFIHVRTPVNTELVTSLRHELHAGEAECMALADEQTSVLLILDDLAARSVAQQHGWPMTGAIGCLQLAKRKGLLPRVGPLLVSLRDQARFWLSPRLLERVVEDANEDLPESL